MPKPVQDSYVGWPQSAQLDHALMIVCEAFGEQCYQVGSSTKGTDFRDVDVRMILDDDKFDALFGSWTAVRWQPFWSLICASISLYLRQTTGLPIDFQIQRRSNVNEADWDEPRTVCGHFPNFEEVKPAWARKKASTAT